MLFISAFPKGNCFLSEFLNYIITVQQSLAIGMVHFKITKDYTS
jgi:hypothetical protein